MHLFFYNAYIKTNLSARVTVIGKKSKTNRSSKRKINCTTEKESVTQSPTCLNINIMTENQCATASNNYQDAMHSETGNNKTNKTLIEHLALFHLVLFQLFYLLGTWIFF
jgi:hypothetical protein